MLGVRLSRCTYCRILAQYVQRRNIIFAGKERSLQVLPANPGLKVARTLRTSQRGLSNTKDPGNDGSSSSDSSSDSSDSDSDKEDSLSKVQKDKEIEKKTSVKKIVTPGTEKEMQTQNYFSSQKNSTTRKESKPFLDLGKVLINRDLNQPEVTTTTDTSTIKAKETQRVKAKEAKTRETKQEEMKKTIDFFARLRKSSERRNRLDVKPETEVQFVMGKPKETLTEEAQEMSKEEKSQQLSVKKSSEGRKRLDVKPENVVQFIMGEPKETLTEEAQEMSKEEKSQQLSVKIDGNIVQAAKEVSQQLPGKPKETEAALIGQLLKQFGSPSEMQVKPRGKVGINLQPKGIESMEVESMSDKYSTILKGFTIKKAGRGGLKRSQRRSDIEGDEKIERREENEARVSTLFNGQPLNIFTEKAEELPIEEMTLFDIVAHEQKLEELKGAPQNAFHEQIQWTKEGKMWRFPIDNEAGWEEEHNTEFYEHVFFDEQLEGFPEKGPVRHFMELVTTALSKNPYLSVRQKHEHIDWYRQYFMEKGAVLKEHLGNMGEVHQPQAS